MHRNYIAGEWLAADNAIENRNPSDITDLIGTYAQADMSQLERALDSARSAQKQWQATGLEARQSALMQIGNALMARADELGELLSREEGKPRGEGRGEVYRAGQFFTYYAAEVLRQIGDNADSVRPGIEIDVRRDPVGIVAVVSPWNFPTATAVSLDVSIARPISCDRSLARSVLARLVASWCLRPRKCCLKLFSKFAAELPLITSPHNPHVLSIIAQPPGAVAAAGFAVASAVRIVPLACIFRRNASTCAADVACASHELQNTVLSSVAISKSSHTVHTRRYARCVVTVGGDFVVMGAREKHARE